MGNGHPSDPEKRQEKINKLHEQCVGKIFTGLCKSLPTDKRLAYARIITQYVFQTQLGNSFISRIIQYVSFTRRSVTTELNAAKTQSMIVILLLFYATRWILVSIIVYNARVIQHSAGLITSITCLHNRTSVTQYTY